MNHFIDFLKHFKPYQSAEMHYNTKSLIFSFKEIQKNFFLHFSF